MSKVLFSLEKCFLFVSVVSFYKMCSIYSLKWYLHSAKATTTSFFFAPLLV